MRKITNTIITVIIIAALLSGCNPNLKPTEETDPKPTQGSISSPDPDTLYLGGNKGSGESVSVIRRDLTLSYLSVDRSIRKRKAKLVIPVTGKDSYPVIISLHYEMPVEDSTSFAFLKADWAVMTPTDIPAMHMQNIVDDDLRFSMAMVSAARRQTEIDSKAIALRGSSAGGYHVLMLSAFSLGICGAYSMSGVSNIAYNLGRYIPQADLTNQAMQESLGPIEKNDITKYPIPYVKSVAMTFGPTISALGAANPESLKWIDASPVSYTESFTQPILFSHSTADLIVPVNQISERHAYEALGTTLPEDYLIRLEDLMEDPVLSLPLDELLEQDEQAVYELPVPQNGQINILRFDPDKRYHFNYIDEGAPESYCSHFKNMSSGLVSDMDFWKHYLSLGAANTNWLTEEKISILAKRFLGSMEYFQAENPRKEETDAKVFGSLYSDKLDVLLEMAAYLGINIHAGREGLSGLKQENLASLSQMISALPADQQIINENILSEDGIDGAQLVLKWMLNEIVANAARCQEIRISNNAEEIVDSMDQG